MIRLTSSIFVDALIRRVSLAGSQAVVARHGSDEAGAIFITVDRLDGTGDLYSPAPQSMLNDDGNADRLFTRVRERVPDAEIAAVMSREVRFDPDLWLVAIEDRAGRCFVEVASP